MIVEIRCFEQETQRVARAVLNEDHHTNDKYEPPVHENSTKNVLFGRADLPAIELVEDLEEDENVEYQSQMKFLVESIVG